MVSIITEGYNAKCMLAKNGLDRIRKGNQESETKRRYYETKKFRKPRTRTNGRKVPGK